MSGNTKAKSGHGGGGSTKVLGSLAMICLVVAAIGGIFVFVHGRSSSGGQATQQLSTPAPTTPAPTFGTQEASLPLTSLPLDKWPNVRVPPSGNSNQVPIPAGMHAVFGGSGFVVYEVYGDKHECAPILEACTDGDIVSAYAKNQTDHELIASYAYERKK